MATGPATHAERFWYFIGTDDKGTMLDTICWEAASTQDAGKIKGFLDHVFKLTCARAVYGPRVRYMGIVLRTIMHAMSCDLPEQKTLVFADAQQKWKNSLSRFTWDWDAFDMKNIDWGTWKYVSTTPKHFHTPNFECFYEKTLIC